MGGVLQRAAILAVAAAIVVGVTAPPRAHAATSGAPVDPTTPPEADVLRTPIPRAVGKRRAHRYRLSIAGIPPGVDRVRYELLVRSAAERWGLRFVGRSARTVRSGDRSDMVGFARGLPRGALGVTRLRVLRVYRRAANGRPRLVRERVLERDLMLAYRAAWHAGPGVPPLDRYDLQTVLIHELGHYAGNGHVRGCANSPMWTGLRPGEWWWSRADWFRFGCRNAPRQPAPLPAPPPAPPVPQAPQRELAPLAARAAGAQPSGRLLVRTTVRRVVLD